jgi:hypothetical protein
MDVKLTSGEIKLLSKCPDKSFEFMKGHAQERSAFDLFRKGLLERRSEMYSMKAGGRSVELRWSYRRTDAGRAAAAASTSDVGAR